MTFSVVLPYYAIRCVMEVDGAGGFQLGLPGEIPRVPSSDDDDESPVKKQKGQPSANKARPEGSRAQKRGRRKEAESKTLSLDMATLEHLLDQNCAKILKANREHAQGLLDALEERQAARFMTIERTIEGMEYTAEGFDQRLRAIEEKLQRGVPQDDESKRRWTLVFGGWEADTRKSTILTELDQAINKLEIKDLFDDPPFTTGPRRAVALCNFAAREGETEGERKGRMHKIVLSFAKQKMLTSSRKKLWAGYSKSREARMLQPIAPGSAGPLLRSRRTTSGWSSANMGLGLHGLGTR